MRFTHLSLPVVVVCALGVGACNTASTPDPGKDAEKALKAANLNDVKVDWDTNAKIAHLQGSVPSASDRQRAEQIAASAVGTTGKVLNETTVKGVDDRTADDMDGQIRTSLKSKIDADPVLKDRSIDFDVNNAVGTVKGNVRTADEKSKVGEIVHSVPGVKDMANALEIKP